MLRISYQCPRCQHKWDDTHESACDAECPSCGERNITPISFTELADDLVCLFCGTRTPMTTALDTGWIPSFWHNDQEHTKGGHGICPVCTGNQLRFNEEYGDFELLPFHPLPVLIEADIIAAIAKKHLFIETLETRNGDRLDFHDVAVWAVKEALTEAFQAGYQAGSVPNK